MIRGALLFFLAICASAQTISGVLLGGTTDAPVVTNQSMRRVLAYGLLVDGRPSITSFLGQVLNKPMNMVGVAPGATYSHNSQRPQIRTATGQPPTPPSSIVLDSVLFDDGRVVGPDKSGLFDQASAMVRAQQDVDAAMLGPDRAAAWAKVQAFASGQISVPDGSHTYQFNYQMLARSHAAELLRVREKAGEPAALNLAQSSSKYPTITKGQ